VKVPGANPKPVSAAAENTAKSAMRGLGGIATELKPPSRTSTVFSRFSGVAREKFFAFNKEFAMIENSDEW
jgi:hypothetical protein